MKKSIANWFDDLSSLSDKEILMEKTDEFDLSEVLSKTKNFDAYIMQLEKE